VPRAPAAVRSLVPHRLALIAVVVTAVLSATLLAALVSFATTVTGYAVRATLRASPATGILITAPASSAAAAAGDSVAVRDALHRALPGGPVAVASSLSTDFLDLPAPLAGSHAQVHVVSLPDPARHAVLAAGTWPGSGSALSSAAIPVAVPAATATRLHLRAGSTLTLQAAAGGKAVTVRVTGVFRRAHLAGGYWALDPAPAEVPQAVGGFTVYPSLVTSLAALTGHQVPVNSAAWVVNLDTGRIGAGSLGSIGNAVQLSLAGLTSAPGLRNAVVTTGLPGLLAGLDRAVVVARSQLAVGILILLVIAGATLALAVSLLSRQREAEATLLRARGASRSQLTRTGLAEAVLLVTPAAVLGPVFGGLLLPVLARRGPLTHSALRIGVAFPAVAWLASVAAAAGCAVVIGRGWLSAAQSPVRARAERGRQRALASAARSGIDLALIALAVLAGWQLAHYKAPVTAGLDGSIGVDPILVSAPVLALAAAAVLMLRLLPAVARIGDRAAARRRDLTAAVAAWQISRRPVRQAGPVLLAVLAVATSVIAVAEWSSWQRSAQDQASFDTGADVRVNLPPAAPLPVGGLAPLVRAPGVTGSTPVIRSQIDLPNSGTAELLALDGRRAATVATVRPDLANGSPAAVLGRLSPPGSPPGAPVPGRPARLLFTASVTAHSVASPVLFVQLTDAFGVSYPVEAGVFTANGRPHAFSVPVAPRHGAAYPLHVTGFALQYIMHKYHGTQAQLVIGPARAATTMTGTAGASFAPGRPGERLASFANPGAPSNLGALVARPAVTRAKASQASVTVAFRTGAGYGPPTKVCGFIPFRYPCGPPGPLPSTLTIAAGGPPAAIPAAVTSAFASAIGAHPGSRFAVDYLSTTIQLRVVSVVHAFPTIAGPFGGAVVDQAALQDAMAAAGALPAPVTEWWLRTSRPVSLAGLPHGTTVTSRAAVAASLLANPLAAAPQLALLAIAAAAVVLAAAGFLVSAATARERAHEMALLAALGATRRQLTRLLCLEQAVVAVPAALAGLLLGVLLAHLVIPAVSLTATGTHPQPPVTVLTPLLVPGAVALLMAIGPVLLAAAGAGTHFRVVAHTRVEATT
jgi:FtsX-like permease family